MRDHLAIGNSHPALVRRGLWLNYMTIAYNTLQGLRRRIDELVKDLQMGGRPRVGNDERSTGGVP